MDADRKTPGKAHKRVTFAFMSDLHITSADCEESVLTRKALDEARRLHPDLIVVAGDLIDNGVVESMAVARGVLEEGVGQHRLLAVPGNHDVHQGKGLDLGPTESGARNVQSLSDFSIRRGGASRLETAPWPVRLDLAGGRCVVYGLDSNRVTGGSFARGRVGPEQLALLDADMASLDRSQRRVVVLHPPSRWRGQPETTPLPDGCG